MAKNSIVSFTGNGSQTQWAVSFTDGYISEDHVTCQVNNEVDGGGDPVFRPITFISPGVIEVGGAVPGVGEPVVFRRTTPVAEPINDFSGGAAFSSDNVDLSFQQVLFGVQEAQDNLEDARFVEEALDEAEAARDAAQAAQLAAETAQTGAQTARTGAESAETNAAQHAADADADRIAAQTARTGAENAQTAAETARTGAETARTGAETAEANAASAAAAADADRILAETARVGAEAAQTAAQAAEVDAEAHKDAAALSAAEATTAAGVDLGAIAAVKAETAVDVFVYDTSQDSDGGAWRERMQHTSWYNEAASATRGSRKTFPAIAVIVLETSKLTIYDGDDPSLPMWAIWEDGVATFGLEWWYSADASSVRALNGQVYFTSNSGSSSRKGLHWINFASDQVGRFSNLTTLGGHGLDASSGAKTDDLPQRNTTTIVDDTCNDIAMTVLPDASVDPATGLQIPTIGVFTDGGVSVVHNGAVVDGVTGTSYSGGTFDADNTLLTYENVGTRSFRYIAWPDYLEDGFAMNKLEKDTSPAILQSPMNSVAGMLLGQDTGLTRLSFEAGATAPMVAYTGTDYATGWMRGDTKGAWLSDTATGALGVPEPQLVTNGTFDTDLTGWGNENSLISWSSGAVFVDRNGQSYGDHLLQDIATVVGLTYTVEFDVNSLSAGVDARITGSTVYATTLTGTHQFTFVATSTTTRLSFAMNGGTAETATLDNISVKIAADLVSNGAFYQSTAGWTDASTGTGSTSWNAGAARVVGVDASNRGILYQAFTTVVGVTYTLSFEVTETVAGNSFPRIGTSADGEQIFTFPNPTTGVYTHTFTAVGTTTYFTMNVTSGTFDYDNVSCRIAVDDRSANGSGLQVFGEIQRNAVATGAELVAYSGFSASNYLQQPYNAAMDFGTGDFCVLGWMKAASGGRLINRQSADQFWNVQNLSGAVSVDFFGGGSLVGSRQVNDDAWHLICVVRRSGTIYLYVDADEDNSQASVTDFTDTDAVLTLGLDFSGIQPFPGSMALWRVGATAPSAAQIRKIYEDEKYLFQENAAATLFGTSDAVTAVATDPVTDLLHVGTSAGRSVFSGLRRVENTTDAVGAAISASQDYVVDE